MLLELNVSQFAIINNIHVKFKSGLNILSGETGAGKSVLLKSLALLMGEKASAETVRAGSEQATVEGLFDISHRQDIRSRLEDQGISVEDDTLVVRRIVSSSGKSKIYINGGLATLQTLQAIVAPLIEVAGQAIPLIEMTGQHENRNLLSKSYHLELLDLYAETRSLREEFETQFHRYTALQAEIEKIEAESRTREQRVDFLKYQRDEIRNLGLKPGEENSLQAEYDRVKNSSRLSEWTTQAEEALLGDEESAIVRLHRVIQRGMELRKYDASIEDRLKTLAEAKSLIEEFAYDLRNYSSSLGEGAEQLDQIESRISDLRKLQKKYGERAEDILSELTKIEGELSTLESSDERLAQLKKDREELGLVLKRQAEGLHTKRTKAAKGLEEAVAGELADLNMKGVQFLVRSTKLESMNSTGLTDVEFMIRASAKDPERSIAKVASGGELSRILLSLKNIIGVGTFPRTYLFDEVDTGVSGPTAEKVGRKLKAIAKGQQVICVTHLPQVACFADHHYVIQKTQARGSAQMTVEELDRSSRVDEIARLISGEKITKTSVAHAKELLGLH